MKTRAAGLPVLITCLALAVPTSPASAQVGRRFPSEKKIIPDPVTGLPLTFLTSTPAGDSKIYQTHPQWTSDGHWLTFRSQRVPGQAFAVNEDDGAIVQLTENGYLGMLCVARRSMKLYFMRGSGPSAPATASATGAVPASPTAQESPAATASSPTTLAATRGTNRSRGPFQIIELDLEKLFTDSAAGTLIPGATAYERVCGTTPPGMTADGNMGLDANEDFADCRITGDDLA